MTLDEPTARFLGAEARAGRRVLVVSADQLQVRAAFDAIGRVSDPVTMRRSAGAEAMDSASGGSVRTTTPRSQRHRGMAVDTVYLDDVDLDMPLARTIDLGHTLRDALMPCLVASKHPEVLTGKLA